tara:strand:- start:52 stop:2124 length:2073 start_codon:yes stop_codon:yes gene_type:complete
MAEALVEYVGHAPKKVAAQTKVSTTEFGYDIFIPFSKKWQQKVTHGNKSLRGSQWSISPRELGAQNEGSMNKEWARVYEAFRNNFDEAVKAYPSTLVRQKSAAMARSLADILYESQENDTGGAEAFKATSGETTDYLAMEYFRLNHNKDDWQHSVKGETTVDGPAALTSGEEREGSFSTLSQKSMDFLATNDDMAANLEYVLNRIAAQEGAPDGFVNNIQGIEVTSMAHEKYFQQELKKVYDESPALSQSQALKISAKRAVENVMKEYRKVGGTIEDAYKDMEKNQGTSEERGNAENVLYIGRQLMDRFWEVTERMFQQSDGKRTAGGAYIYQIPMSGGYQYPRGTFVPLMGLIRLEPVFKKTGKPAGGFGDLILTKIKTQTMVIDLSTSFNLEGDFKELSTAAGYQYMIGLLGNFLIQDGIKNLNSEHVREVLMGDRAARDLANNLVLAGRRMDLIGSSLWTMTEGTLQTFRPEVFIQAVKTLTTPEIAESLKTQFENFLSDSSESGKYMSKEFAAFYANAIMNSQTITKTWLKRIGRDWSKWKGTENSIFSKKWGYTGGMSPSGEGVAAAWFMNSGRDAGGWEEFKERATQDDMTQFLVKLDKGEISQIGQKAGYDQAIPVGMPDTPEGKEAYRTGLGQFHRYMDPSTLLDGQMTSDTYTYAHGGYRMGGSGNPFLVSKKAPFFKPIK